MSSEIRQGIAAEASELSRFGYRQNAGAKFIEVRLAWRLPFLIRFVSGNLHWMGELLPELNPEDVKEDYARVTPISPELMKILLELKQGVASIDGAVFVRKNGKPIRSIQEAFNVAREKTDIPNAIMHDIRRSTIRRWEAMGISRQAVMQASGHCPVTVHEKYAELSEEQLLEAFQPLMVPASQRKKYAAGAKAV